jgi:hypothetical protein
MPGGFDSSGILQAKAPDIIGTLGQVQAIKNAQAQNALLNIEAQQAQGKLAAQNEYGHQLQINIDPETGQINYPNALAATAKNPNAALGFSDIANQNIAQQTGTANTGTAQQQLTQAKYKTLGDHLGMVGNTIASLLAEKNADGTPATLTAGHVVDKAVQLVKNSPLAGTDEGQSFVGHAADLVSQIGPDPSPDDPAYQAKMAMRDKTIRAALTPIMAQAQTAQQQVEEALGKPGAVETGANIQPTVSQPLAPQAGVRPAGAPIAKELSPEAKLGRVQTVSPETGLAGTIPVTATNDIHGNPTRAGGFVPTSMAPGQQGYFEANTQRANAIQARAASSPLVLSAMNDVRSVVKNVPDTAFGPTKELTGAIGKIAAALHLAPPQAVNGVASLDELEKSLNTIAANQGAELGAHTDASRATVTSANPSLYNSKEGLLRNLAVVQGNEEYAVAKNRALQQVLKEGMPASATPAFEAAFNAKISPLVFQLQHMTPQSQREVWKTLSPADRQHVLDATKAAETPKLWGGASLFEGQ